MFSSKFCHKATLLGVVPALLQKLVGEFFLIFRRKFGKVSGKFGGNFPGFFLTHRTKAQNFRGNFWSIFRKKIRSSKKIFRAKFTLQTCHLKNCPRGEGNCAATERQKLSRGNFCLPASRCLSGPSGLKQWQSRKFGADIHALEVGTSMIPP